MLTTPDLLKYRVPALFALMVVFEAVNSIKLADAFGWTNHFPLGPIAAVSLALFLIGSIIALSFDLDDDLRNRLTLMVGLLFLVQTALICVVSFLFSLTLMPAAQIAL